MCSNPVFLSLPPSFPFISLPHICFHVVSLVLCYCCNCNQIDHKGDFTLSFSLKSVLIRFSLNFGEGCGVTQKEHRKFADAEIIERFQWKVDHLGKVTCARPRSSSCWTRLQPGMLECSAQSEFPGRTSPGEPKNKRCRTKRKVDRWSKSLRHRCEDASSSPVHPHLIQQNDPRFFQDRSGNRHPLLLPAAQFQTSFTDICVISCRNIITSLKSFFIRRFYSSPSLVPNSMLIRACSMFTHPSLTLW